jgi:hypothetical protein
MPGSETEAAGMLVHYLAAAADAGAQQAKPPPAGKCGKNFGVREGLERSQAGGGHGRLSFDRGR